jgi:hypothetical protein
VTVVEWLVLAGAVIAIAAVNWWFFVAAGASEKRSKP